MNNDSTKKDKENEKGNKRRKMNMKKHNKMKKEEGRRRKREEEGKRRKKKKKEEEVEQEEEEEEEEGGEEYKQETREKKGARRRPQNYQKNLQNTVRGWTRPDPPKRTCLDGAFAFFFSMGSPETTRKKKVLSGKNPEEHPQNTQFIKKHENPDVAFPNILGFFGDNVRP